MKRLPILAASLVLFALNGCGGDNSPTGINGNTNAGDGTMTAAINGAAWRSMKAGGHNGQIYAVVGLNGTYTIALGIAGLTAPGTVDLSLGAPYASPLEQSIVRAGRSRARQGRPRSQPR